MIDLPGKFVSDHLHIDRLPHAKPNRSDEVFIYPGLKLTHPEKFEVSKVKRVKVTRSEIVNEGNMCRSAI